MFVQIKLATFNYLIIIKQDDGLGITYITDDSDGNDKIAIKIGLAHNFVHRREFVPKRLDNCTILYCTYCR